MPYISKKKQNTFANVLVLLLFVLILHPFNGHRKLVSLGLKLQPSLSSAECYNVLSPLFDKVDFAYLE